MNCNAHRESMMRFFDGDLDDISRAQLKQHLKTCKECCQEFENLSSILACLEKDNGIEPPLNFEEEVMTKIQALEAIKKRNIRILMYAIPILIAISISMLTTAKLMGGFAFDILVDSIGDYIGVAGIATKVYNTIEVLFKLSSGVASGIYEVSIAIVRTYYYIFVMLATMLFAIEWMLVALVKQSWRGATK